jgi:hypothetical protein
VTLTQAITELAALASGRSHWIDMAYGNYATGHVKLEWTVTVKMGESTASFECWHGATLDKAMTAARAALRPVSVPDAVAAADGALA